MKYYKSKNQVIVNYFDEFAQLLEGFDFSTEDIVSLVVSSSKTFYFLNTESVWGQIGFTWDTQDENKRGYGHFNKTTIPISIIPKLPDGERITEFNDSFNNIDSIELDIKKSNWQNLHSLVRLNTSGKKMTIDLEGANITTIRKLIDLNNATLYFKNADFSNVINDNYYEICNGSNNSYFIIDDDNKYWNLPAKQFACGLYYKGTGPLKYEYWFKEDTLVNLNNNSLAHCLRSDNNEYYINIYNNNYFLLSAYSPNIYQCRDRRTIPTEEDVPENITLDTTKAVNANDIILYPYYCLLSSLHYNAGTNTYSHYTLPINIIGNFKYCDSIAPFALVNENNDWVNSNYANNILNKGFKTNTNLYFEYYPHSYLRPKSTPNYSLDVDKFSKIRFFNNATFIKENNTNDDVYIDSGVYRNEDFYGDKNAITFLPNIYSSSINNNVNTVDDYECNEFYLLNHHYFYTASHDYALIDFKIKAKSINISTGGFAKLAISNNCRLSFSYLYLYTMVCNDITTPKFKLNFVQGVPCGIMGAGDGAITKLLSMPPDSTYINLIEINTTDKDYIASCLGNSRCAPIIYQTNSYCAKIHNPVIIAGMFSNTIYDVGFFSNNWNGLGTKCLDIFDDDTPFIMIYRQNINLSIFTDSEKDTVIYKFRRYILNNIYPLPNAKEAVICFTQAQINMLTDAEKNKLENELHYEIVVK